MHSFPPKKTKERTPIEHQLNTVKGCALTLNINDKHSTKSIKERWETELIYFFTTPKLKSK